MSTLKAKYGIWLTVGGVQIAEFRQYAASTKDTENMKSNNIHTLQVCSALQTTICCILDGRVNVELSEKFFF